jgi:hypothetical protein
LTTELLTRLLCLFLFAFGINIPLGYIREAATRFSVRWFVLIHFSIPFLVALRYHLEFGWSVIPFSIAFAVAGQFLGGRIRKRNVAQ